MTDITDAGPRLKSMNDRLEELRTAADLADAEYRDEIAHLKDEVRRLESVIAASGAGNCPDLDNAAKQDILTDLEKWAIASAAMDAESHQHTKRAATLNSLLERLRYTPATHHTPSEFIEQNGCTLTAAEREAVRFCRTASLPETAKLGGAAEELCRIHGWTLRALLDRLGGGR